MNGIHDRCPAVLYMKDCSMWCLGTLILGLSSPSYFDVVELHGNKSHSIIKGRIVYLCIFRNNLFYYVDNGFYVELDRTHHQKFGVCAGLSACLASASIFSRHSQASSMSPKSVINMNLLEWNIHFFSLFLQVRGLFCPFLVLQSICV